MGRWVDVTRPISEFLELSLPLGVEPYLRRVLASTIPRVGDRGRYRIAACGRFRGSLTAELMALATNRRLDAALILAESDLERVLYFCEGLLVGSSSSVLFERLGRLLAQEGIVGRAHAETLVNVEEMHGDVAAVAALSDDAVLWALERRVEAVVAASYFMSQGHFLLVEGAPDLGALPRVSIDPMPVALEGLRLYDEWRNQSTAPAQVRDAG